MKEKIVMEDKNTLRTAFQNKQYNKCVEIISNKIMDDIAEDIRNYNKNFNYVDIFDLINASKVYLTDYKSDIVKKISLIQMGNLDELIKISLLINMYKELKKK